MTETTFGMSDPVVSGVPNHAEAAHGNSRFLVYVGKVSSRSFFLEQPGYIITTRFYNERHTKIKQAS